MSTMDKFAAIFIVVPLLFALNIAQSMGGKEYINRNPSQCESLRFLCEPGKEPFYDDQGCGCTPERKTNSNTFCTEEYRPVCGIQNIQCITTPCEPIQQTYPNRCYAERDGATNITEGECR